jgi:Predicted transcriptional regulators
MAETQFGKWLKKWRKARRLTQVQLSAEIDYTDAYISALERGVKHDSGADIRPSEDFVEKVATALGRPVEEARLLAGYHASPIPVTLSEVSEILKQNPGFGAFIDANDPAGYTLLPNSLLADINDALQKIKASLPNDSKK